MRATPALIAGVGLGAALALTVNWFVGREDDAAAAVASEEVDLTTAEVRVMDLRSYIEFEGELTQGHRSTIAAGRSGTVTTGVDVGTILEAGAIVATIDAEPVVLLQGDLPQWRELSTASEPGPDIAMLEANLIALGHDPDGAIEVDGSFTSATADAVLRWESALELATPDGVVEKGQVVVAPGAVQVVTAPSIGASVRADSPLFQAVPADNDPTVRISVAVSEADTFAIGQAVEVVMPDDEVVAATVDGIGNEVAAAQGQNGDPTLEVTLSLQRAPTSGFTAAPVTVRVVDGEVLGATAVPTRALVALAEGGQAVELVTDAGVRLVAVELGRFSDGFVEVTNDSVSPGADVVVPS